MVVIVGCYLLYKLVVHILHAIPVMLFDMLCSSHYSCIHIEISTCWWKELIKIENACP